MAESGGGGGKYSPKYNTVRNPDGSQQWVRGATLGERLATLTKYPGEGKLHSGPYDKKGRSPLTMTSRAMIDEINRGRR